MLIKNTYDDIPGVLKSFFVTGLKIFEIFSTKLKLVKSFVKNKKGKRAGTTFVSQTFVPFKKLCMYFAGVKINKKIKKHTTKTTKTLKSFKCETFMFYYIFFKFYIEQNMTKSLYLVAFLFLFW